MIDTPIEVFTAYEAKEAGLIQAVKRGETKINGTFEITQKGDLDLVVNNFVFKDKFGKLRAGNFEDQVEMMKFRLGF